MMNQGKVLRNMFLTSNLNKHIKKCKITFQVDKWISFELSFVTLDTRGQVERIALWYTVKLCHLTVHPSSCLFHVWSLNTHTHVFLVGWMQNISSDSDALFCPVSAVQVMMSYRSGLRKAGRASPPANEEQNHHLMSVRDHHTHSYSQISPQDTWAGDLTLQEQVRPD